MKKHFLILTILFLTISLTCDVAKASPMEENQREKTEKIHKQPERINKHKADELIKKGYTKEEIFMGAMMAKRSGTVIEEIFALYKKYQSWEKTSNILGISNEDFQKMNSMYQWKQFVKNNEDDVISYLAMYTNKDKSEIQAYIQDGIPINDLITSAIIAKLVKTDLEEIVQFKEQGRPLHHLFKKYKISHDSFHKELEQFKKKVQERQEEHDA